MKIIKFALIMLLGIVLPISVLAEDQTDMPKVETVGDITYVSGGIGESEADLMESFSKNYALEIVFVQKLKQREEFLADVKVQIQDAHKNVVLDTITNGPYLYARMPQGKYLIVAEHNNDVKRQWVRVITKKHKKIVFWWPILE